MNEKCKVEANFSNCYRTLMCKNPKVCHDWKCKVGCPMTDDDAAVKNASKGRAASCALVAHLCNHQSQVGDLVRLHCAKTCCTQHQSSTPLDCFNLPIDGMDGDASFHGGAFFFGGGNR